MEASSRASSRLTVLDGLRAVAILLVIFSHACDTTSLPHNVILFIEEIGNFGVDLFFVLSGFLITSLLLRELVVAGKIDIRGFYERRLRRIFPALYVYMAVIGALALAKVIDVPFMDWLAAVLYLTNYPIGESIVWWTGHTWSLSLEEQFYLLWPALLVLAGILRAKRFAIAIMIVLPFVRVLTYFFAPSLRVYIHVMLHTRLDTIMAGCLLAILWNEKSRFRSITDGTRGTVLLCLIPIAAIGEFTFHHYKGYAYLFIAGYTLNALSFMLVVNYVLTRPASWLARVLTVKPITWFGRISYSLYLWQQPFLTPFNHTILGVFPLNILFAVAMACASYYWIERRFYKRREGKLALDGAAYAKTT